MYSDLHLHTAFSDGRLSPAEVVREATKVRMEYIAISDHDCLDGVDEALKAGARMGITVIPAVEFSCVIPDVKKETHILGYIKDYKNRKLKRLLKYFAEAREERAKGMLSLLEELGVKIDYETVKEIAGYGTVGRPHIARAIVKTGAARSFLQAFEKFLSEGAPAYLPKAEFSVEAAVSAIHNADGFAVWAHPPIEVLVKHIERFRKSGLDGIEAFHPLFSGKESRKLIKIARRLDMYITGGSDWHNIERDGPFGSFRVKTEDLLGFLKAYFKTL